MMIGRVLCGELCEESATCRLSGVTAAQTEIRNSLAAGAAARDRCADSLLKYAPLMTDEPVQRRKRLGGLLNYYYRAA